MEIFQEPSKSVIKFIGNRLLLTDYKFNKQLINYWKEGRRKTNRSKKAQNTIIPRSMCYIQQQLLVSEHPSLS